MKKKILSIILVATMSCSLLVGCGGKEATVEENIDNSVVTEATNELGILPLPTDIESSVVEEVSEVESQETMVEESIIDLEIEVFEEETSNDIVDVEDGERINYSTLEEVDALTDVYDLDFTRIVPTNNVLMEMEFEDLYKMSVGMCGEDAIIKVGNNLMDYNMYIIDGITYSSVYDATTNETIYKYCKEMTEDATSNFETNEYNENNVVEWEYSKSVTDGENIYDVFVVKTDNRTEEEKEMLAYETPNGIMYLTEGTSMTIDDVTYGGEDGVAPLEEVPLVDNIFYIERETKTLRAIEYVQDDISILMHILGLDEVILPEEFEGATEVAEDEIAMDMFGVLMGVIMGAMETERIEI